MKKIFLVISIISVLFLVGCNKKENVNNNEIENIQNREEGEIIINSGESNIQEQDEINNSGENLSKETDIDKEAIEQIEESIKTSGYDLNTFKLFVEKLTVVESEKEITKNVYIRKRIVPNSANLEEIIPELQYYMSSNIYLSFENEKINIDSYGVNLKYYINDNILTLLEHNVYDGPVYYSIYNIDLKNKKELTQEEFKKLYNVEDSNKEHIYFINKDAELCYEVIDKEYSGGVVPEGAGSKVYRAKTGEEIKDFFDDYGTENLDNIEEVNNQQKNESNNLVYTFYEDRGVKIPYINIDSEDVKNFNNKMKELAATIEYQRKKNKELLDNDEEYFKFQEEVMGSWYEGVEYSFYENGDILSLVIEYSRGFISGWMDYEVYNVNTKTGKIYNQLDLVNSLLEKDNLMSEEELMQKIKEAYIKQINIYIEKEIPSDTILNTQKLKDFYEKDIVQNLVDVKLYVGKDKKIYIIMSLDHDVAGVSWHNIELCI